MNKPFTTTLSRVAARDQQWAPCCICRAPGKWAYIDTQIGGYVCDECVKPAIEAERCLYGANGGSHPKYTRE